MSLNQNGLKAANWTVNQYYSPVSEGAIVGISFGWIIGVIGFYILGVCLICKCVQNRREDHSEENEKKESGETKNDSQGLQLNLQRKNRKYEEKDSSDQLQDGRRKRIPENINTEFEMMESEKPSVQQSVTYKLGKSS